MSMSVEKVELFVVLFFFFQAEDGIRDLTVTGVQTCALPIWPGRRRDLLPAQRASAVLDGQRAVPPFAHQHFALRWRVVTALRLQLEKSIVEIGRASCRERV